ncbi:MAG: hypothetical protein PHD05_00400 [Sphaerochaetaceae bacterium]|nr:hypothetical protein [Sphaerochaetaceae bacterium]
MNSSDQSPCKTCSRENFPKCIDKCEKLSIYQLQFVDKLDLINYDEIIEHSICVSTAPWRQKHKAFY